MPLAKKAYSRAPDTDVKRRVGAGGVRCAMALNDTASAADLIAILYRDFPRDPDILYLTVHTYSDLSLRASQALLFTNPGVYQVTIKVSDMLSKQTIAPTAKFAVE